MESQLNQKVTSINIFVNSRQIQMNTSPLVGLKQVCGLEINLAFTKNLWRRVRAFSLVPLMGRGGYWQWLSVRAEMGDLNTGEK